MPVPLSQCRLEGSGAASVEPGVDDSDLRVRPPLNHPPTQPFPPVPLQTARFRYSTLTVPVALALAVVARRRRRLLAAAVARLHRCSPPLLAASVAAFPSVPARLSISLVHLRCCGCRYARNRPQPSPSLSHSLALALAVAIEQGVTFISSRTLCECPGGRGRPAAPVCSRRGAGEIPPKHRVARPIWIGE